MPQIEVSFDIDANGILNVSAKDKGTGKEQKVRIESSSGLSKDEVEKMRRDAEQNAEEDERRKQVAEARNKAEQTIYQIDKMVKEHGDKVGADVKAAIEQKKKALEDLKAKDDPAAIERGIEELMTASQEVAKQVYAKVAQEQAAAAGPSGPPPGPAGGKKGDEGVIDADFEVK